LENRRGWRIRKVGNSMQQYSESFDGNWRSIEFKFEMYSKEVPRHAIIIPKEWGNYPDWARLNKKMILSRISQVFKEPQYTMIER